MPTLEEIFLRVTSAGATGGTDAPADVKPANGHSGAQNKGVTAGAAVPKLAGATTNGHVNGHANGNADATEPQKPLTRAENMASAALNGRDAQRQTSGKTQRQPSASAPSSAAAEASSGSRALVAFREMYRKRALIASRDKKGAVFTLLIPVLAVAFVLVSFPAPDMLLVYGPCLTCSVFTLLAAYCELEDPDLGKRPLCFQLLHARQWLPILLFACAAVDFEGQHRPYVAQLARDAADHGCERHPAHICKQVAICVALTHSRRPCQVTDCCV